MDMFMAIQPQVILANFFNEIKFGVTGPKKSSHSWLTDVCTVSLLPKRSLYRKLPLQSWVDWSMTLFFLITVTWTVSDCFIYWMNTVDFHRLWLWKMERFVPRCSYLRLYGSPGLGLQNWARRPGIQSWWFCGCTALLRHWISTSACPSV